jgi:hypothetical protein
MYQDHAFVISGRVYLKNTKMAKARAEIWPRNIFQGSEFINLDSQDLKFNPEKSPQFGNCLGAEKFPQ